MFFSPFQLPKQWPAHAKTKMKLRETCGKSDLCSFADHSASYFPVWPQSANKKLARLTCLEALPWAPVSQSLGFFLMSFVNLCGTCRNRTFYRSFRRLNLVTPTTGAFWKPKKLLKKEVTKHQQLISGAGYRFATTQGSNSQVFLVASNATTSVVRNLSDNVFSADEANLDF